MLSNKKNRGLQRFGQALSFKKEFLDYIPVKWFRLRTFKGRWITMRVLSLFTLGFFCSLLLKFYYFSLPFLVLTVLLGSYLLIIRFPTKKLRKQLAITVLGGVLGSLYLSGYTAIVHKPVQIYDNTTMDVIFTLIEFPEEQTYSYSVVANIEFPTGQEVKSLIYTDDQVATLKPGDKVSGTLELSFADKSYSGTDITTYTSKGILMRGKTIGDLVYIESESDKMFYYPTFFANRLREGISNVFVAPYSGVILALITGNTDELSLEFATALSRAGLSHTVAVSGMHLGFLALLLHFLLPKGKTWSTLVFMTVMIFFMLMSGSTPSIVRATIMALILKCASLVQRENDNFTSLSLAVMIILLLNPYAITHIGLHLSVASLLGIFFFAEPFQKWGMEFFQLKEMEVESWQYKCKKYPIVSIATSLSAVSLITPLLAYYFGTVSLVAPLSNLIALWAVSLIFAGGLLASVFGLVFPPFGTLLALIVVPLIDYLQWIVIILGNIPFSTVVLDSVYYVAWLIFIYVLFLIMMCMKGKIPVILVLCSVSCTFFVSALLHSQSIYQKPFLAQVLNTGQGQSTLFYLGDTLILSDCGGNSYENAGNLAANAITNLGRSTLDLLVISHCDTDHINGVIQLMNRIQVARIAMPPLDIEDSRQLEIVKKAEEAGTEVWFIDDLQRFEIDSYRNITIFPSVGTGSTNETGICLLLSVGENDVLVTGDIGTTTEENLVERFGLSEIEVLFISHHGSRYSTSSAFLDAITPQRAIICVGAYNNYGHPTQQVLDKLIEREIYIYRTDEMGTLYFSLP